MRSDLLRYVSVAEIALRYHKARAQRKLWPELELVTELVKCSARSRVIDVGANVGLYAFHFSRIAQFVEAFEPLPWCANKLRAAHMDHVQVHQTALSNTSGKSVLHVPMRSGKPQTYASSLRGFAAGVPVQEVDVTTRRLDDFGFRDIALIKIDVEGHEWSVIEGSKDTIRCERPLLHVEVEQRHLGNGDTVASLIARVGALGYQGFMLNKGEPQDCRLFDASLHQEPYALDVASGKLVRAYVNNFLFVPVGSDVLTQLQRRSHST